jgi:hypothetical protein
MKVTPLHTKTHSRILELCKWLPDWDFWVIKAVRINITVFWNVNSGIFVDRYETTRGHIPEDHNLTRCLRATVLSQSSYCSIPSLLKPNFISVFKTSRHLSLPTIRILGPYFFDSHFNIIFTHTSWSFKLRVSLSLILGSVVDRVNPMENMCTWRWS